MPFEHDLAALFTAISTKDEMADFLNEMFSEKELANLALRWRLMCDLHSGKSQRSIAAEHGISLCKITRGAKILQREGALTPKLIEKIYGGCNEQKTG